MKFIEFVELLLVLYTGIGYKPRMQDINTRGALGPKGKKYHGLYPTFDVYQQTYLLVENVSNKVSSISKTFDQDQFGEFCRQG
jgi:hypothetical protein